MAAISALRRSCVGTSSSRRRLSAATWPGIRTSSTPRLAITLGLVAASWLLREAVTAVDGPARCRLEWHLRPLSAAAADDIEHLARATAAAAVGTAAQATPGGPAIRAAPRLVHQPARSVELLLTACEREGLVAVAASKGLVFEAHLVS